MEAYGLFERKYIATPGLNGKREREVGKHDFGGNAAVAARPAMILGFFSLGAMGTEKYAFSVDVAVAARPAILFEGAWELKSMLLAWMWL